MLLIMESWFVIFSLKPLFAFYDSCLIKIWLFSGRWPLAFWQNTRYFIRPRIGTHFALIKYLSVVFLAVKLVEMTAFISFTTKLLQILNALTKDRWLFLSSNVDCWTLVTTFVDMFARFSRGVTLCSLPQLQERSILHMPG